jgi:hypothetical protein
MRVPSLACCLIQRRFEPGDAGNSERYMPFLARFGAHPALGNPQELQILHWEEERSNELLALLVLCLLGTAHCPSKAHYECISE